MTRYFTADLHLVHRNIIDYCKRPFPDVDAMNAALVDRWNDTVGPSDEVIVLGDVAMGRIHETLGLVADLHGRKVLLAGNHDRCWAGHAKGADDATARYRTAGFDEVWQGTVTLDLAVVLACHFPYDGDSHDGDRYVSHRPVDRGDWLLHGHVHVHDRWTVRNRMVNVGVDV